MEFEMFHILCIFEAWYLNTNIDSLVLNDSMNIKASVRNMCKSTFGTLAPVLKTIFASMHVLSYHQGAVHQFTIDKRPDLFSTVQCF